MPYIFGANWSKSHGGCGATIGSNQELLNEPTNQSLKGLPLNLPHLAGNAAGRGGVADVDLVVHGVGGDGGRHDGAPEVAGRP